MNYAFYSLATGWCHQRTKLDPGEVPREPLPGEGRIPIDQKVFDAWFAQWKGGGDKDPIQEYLSSLIGTPIDADYAIVQNGVVVNVVGKADPALGHLDYELNTRAGAQAVKAKAVAMGATYDAQAKTFTNPVEPAIAKGAISGN